VFQHVPFEGPANLASWLRARGASLSTTRVWAGDAIPPPESFDWLVVMGGPMNADDEPRFPWLAGEKRAIERAVAARKRVLGVCLGAQLVARVLGAKVTRNRETEIGWFPIERVAGAEASAVGRALPARAEVFHWHGDTFALPDGALPLARSAACEQQAFVYDERVLALQFHVEMTPAGVRALIENCGDELVPGRFVQSRDELVADASRFVRIEALMGRVLEAFSGGAHE
jgi:GMP synthase-like glutamine amidotransferase